jgi:hypothetical protein
VESNEISHNFLLKLFGKTGHKKGIRFFDRYQIGKELDLNIIQTRDIVDISIRWICSQRRSCSY